MWLEIHLTLQRCWVSHGTCGRTKAEREGGTTPGATVDPGQGHSDTRASSEGSPETYGSEDTLKMTK